jgi:hypothetical protein
MRICLLHGLFFFRFELNFDSTNEHLLPNSLFPLSFQRSFLLGLDVIRPFLTSITSFVSVLQIVSISLSSPFLARLSFFTQEQITSKQSGRVTPTLQANKLSTKHQNCFDSSILICIRLFSNCRVFVLKRFDQTSNLML